MNICVGGGAASKWRRDASNRLRMPHIIDFCPAKTFKLLMRHTTLSLFKIKLFPLVFDEPSKFGQ